MIALTPFSFWRSLTQTSKGSGTGQREALLEKFTDFPAVQKFQPPLRAHQAMLPLCSPWGEQSYRRNLQRVVGAINPRTLHRAGGMGCCWRPPQEVLGGENKKQGVNPGASLAENEAREGKGKEGHGEEEAERPW